MHLLDNVLLPTASTCERSIITLAGYEHNDSSVIVHRSMIGSHRWKKTRKIADFFGETRFEVKVKSPKWNIAVLSIADLVHTAGCPKIG